MKKILSFFVLLSFFLSACTNADPKKMANDLCDCVKSQKKLSAKSKKIVMKAAKGGDFSTTIQEEIEKINDEEKKQEVNDEIDEFLTEIRSSEIKDCANKIDKKYKVAKSDEKDMQKKLIEEMQEVTDCEAYAAIVSAGLKKNAGSDTDDEATDEADDEKPAKKKKKTAEDEEQ